LKILDFNERLKNSILIADGAMGSLLHEAVGAQRCFDELNTTEPEAVFRVHQAYINAGAHIIETNTFGANRFKLSALGLADDVQRLNSRGVKIAKCSSPGRLVRWESACKLGTRNLKKFFRFFWNRPWLWKNAGSTCTSLKPSPT